MLGLWLGLCPFVLNELYSLLEFCAQLSITHMGFSKSRARWKDFRKVEEERD